MASSMQQGPMENSNFTAIEGAVATMRLMHGIEGKIAAETPLDRKEIDYLYQLDLPVYERTRDDWPWGYYEDDDPALTARIERYQAAKRGAYNATVEALREDYGHDADWILTHHSELDQKVEALLAAGATPKLLAENLSPADRLQHFELLNAYGAALDPHEVYLAFSKQEFHRVPFQISEAFVDTYAQQLIEIDGVPRRLANNLLRNAEEGEIEKNIEDLLRLGVERETILGYLSAEIIQTRFQWLQDSGFDTRGLISRCNTAFLLDNFDTLFREDPEMMLWLADNQKTTEEQVGYIIALHRNGQPIDSHLKTMNSGAHFNHTPYYEALLAAGIGIDAIVDTFSNKGLSMIHMYAPWLMEHGANPDAIKAKLTPEVIVKVREALRAAGIEVNLQEYVDQLPASSVITTRHDIERDGDVSIDYDAQLETYEYELEARAALQFIDAGVDPKKVFAKLPAGGVINDHMVQLFVKAGIEHQQVWEKTSDSMKAAARWQALTTEHSTDEAFEAALKALPADRIDADIIDIVIKRPAFMNLLTDRLTESDHVNRYMKMLIENGADANHVIRRVSKDFYMLYNDATWLLEQGADAAFLFDLIADRYMSAELLNTFMERGVSPQAIFNSIDSEYVTYHFDKLIAMGFERNELLARAMDKPVPQFIIEHLGELHQIGYSADELSSHLEPRQVVENVQELLLAGLTPALAVAQVMEVHRCSQARAEEILTARLRVAS